ncbi:hypothetical protein B9T31_16785 [Acinetobacter sp. ANC 4558]|uniref:hypothetical protein n=1 Tax=Acinetobacter sp. ANC 4558 TaxID=1977876 RepID=UPI000A346F53|nr:hypothetical protein [Acinetobacter sp. ANC 4558]OTG79781.1 hypothetical protein B9T31_16785 [Acinetobacter sp. ANC 4558]
MELQLEHSRDIWINAFFTGNCEVLAQYEHDTFKVIYEQDGRVESNYTRYDRITHAVQNGVWKPRNPEIEFEEFEFNRDETICDVLIGLDQNLHLIQEHWIYEQGWKITELKFLKKTSKQRA